MLYKYLNIQRLKEKAWKEACEIFDRDIVPGCLRISWTHTEI